MQPSFPRTNDIRSAGFRNARQIFAGLNGHKTNCISSNCRNLKDQNNSSEKFMDSSTKFYFYENFVLDVSRNILF